MTEQRFDLRATWTGGLDGTGHIHAGNLTTPISVPREFDGAGIGSNPEEMLLGAAATCYIITLGALLQRTNYLSLELQSSIYVANRPTMKVNAIIHRPHIMLPADVSAELLDKISKAAYRAEQSCMISKALRGNVEVRVEPEIHKQVTEPFHMNEESDPN